MKTLFSSVAALLALALGMATSAAASVQTNIVIPFNATLSNACLGEPVTLTGNLHVLVIVQETGNGTFVLTHAQPQGIEGTGQTSGALYRGTGVTRSSAFLDAAPPFDVTFVNNFRIIGAGDANNFMVHQVVHMTVNANGEVTATVSQIDVSCQP
jgi:hypothetical protein